MAQVTELRLSEDHFGRLLFESESGVLYEAVVPVRAFPMAAPREGISLMGPDGHELAWIAHLDEVEPLSARQLIESHLETREFVPEIQAIVAVSSFATPSTWTVRTDRGDAELVLKGEEDIRRLSRTALLVADRHGVHYLIRDLSTLDRHSRRLLDRFL
ncbi:MAG: DUF1854 domain-containing protein [Burkholderiales bacterium]|jgi:hypothetical protein